MIVLHGQTNELDRFTIQIKLNTLSHQPIIRTLTDVFQIDRIHQDLLSKFTSNPPEQPFHLLAHQPTRFDEHNTFFLQITLRQMTIDERFSFDIIYQSDSSNDERRRDLTGNYFDEEIHRLKDQFDQQFEQIFQLKNKQKMDDKHIHFARSTLSNLLGGISYFSGRYT